MVIVNEEKILYVCRWIDIDKIIYLDHCCICHVAGVLLNSLTILFK